MIKAAIAHNGILEGIAITARKMITEVKLFSVQTIARLQCLRWLHCVWSRFIIILCHKAKILFTLSKQLLCLCGV